MANGQTDAVKLSQLRALAAVAELGNFSEAALHLGISQSAVSHAIATLEDELGVILVMRGRHGARLLPVGERVLRHTQMILQGVEAIRHEANVSKGLDAGTLRIASFRSVATHILPTVIAELNRRFPGLQVEIVEHYDYEGVERALRIGEVDAGFTYLPAPPEFEVWEMLRDDFIVLLPPHARELEEPPSWDVIQRFPLIMTPENDSCCRLVAEHFARHGQSLSITYRVREDSTTMSMVQRGLGATVMPRLAAEPIPPEIQIYRLPEPLQRVIGAAIVADRLQPPAVFALLDVLRDLSDRGQAVKATPTRTRVAPPDEVPFPAQSP